MDDIVIRPAIEADAEAIGKLWEDLVSYHHALDERLPTAAEEGGARYARRVVHRLGDTYTRFLVAEDTSGAKGPYESGPIIGFALGLIIDIVPEMFVQETGGFLADIYVDAGYRRSGVGRELVTEMMGWFRSRGVQQMEWYVAAHNTAGRAFWDTMGGSDVMIRMRVGL